MVSNVMWSDYREHLSCGICENMYDNPKVLPCMHSFCEKCLRLKLTNHTEIQCPKCEQRLNVEDVSILPDDVILKTLLELANETHSSNKICDFCRRMRNQENEAVSKCNECAKYLCDKCVFAHQQTKVTQTHTLKQLRAVDVKCDRHPEELIRFFCKNCGKCVCILCTFDEIHSFHDVWAFKDCIDQHQAALRKQLQDCKSKMVDALTAIERMKKVEETWREIEKQIQDTAKEFHLQIDEKQRDLSAQLSRMFNLNGNFEQLEAKRKAAIPALNELEKIRPLIEPIIERKSIEMLLLKNNIEEKMNAFLDADFDDNIRNQHVEFATGSLNLGELTMKQDLKDRMLADNDHHPSEPEDTVKVFVHRGSDPFPMGVNKILHCISTNTEPLDENDETAAEAAETTPEVPETTDDVPDKLGEDKQTTTENAEQPEQKDQSSWAQIPESPRQDTGTVTELKMVDIDMRSFDELLDSAGNTYTSEGDSDIEQLFQAHINNETPKPKEEDKEAAMEAAVKDTLTAICNAVEKNLLEHEIKKGFFLGANQSRMDADSLDESDTSDRDWMPEDVSETDEYERRSRRASKELKQYFYRNEAMGAEKAGEKKAMTSFHEIAKGRKRSSHTVDDSAILDRYDSDSDEEPVDTLPTIHEDLTGTVQRTPLNKGFVRRHIHSASTHKKKRRLSRRDRISDPVTERRRFHIGKPEALWKIEHNTSFRLARKSPLDIPTIKQTQPGCIIIKGNTQKLSPTLDSNNNAIVADDNFHPSLQLRRSTSQNVDQLQLLTKKLENSPRSPQLKQRSQSLSSLTTYQLSEETRKKITQLTKAEINQKKHKSLIDIISELETFEETLAGYIWEAQTLPRRKKSKQKPEASIIEEKEAVKKTPPKKQESMVNGWSPISTHAPRSPTPPPPLQPLELKTVPHMSKLPSNAIDINEDEQNVSFPTIRKPRDFWVKQERLKKTINQMEEEVWVSQQLQFKDDRVPKNYKAAKRMIENKIVQNGPVVHNLVPRRHVLNQEQAQPETPLQLVITEDPPPKPERKIPVAPWRKNRSPRQVEPVAQIKEMKVKQARVTPIRKATSPTMSMEAKVEPKLPRKGNVSESEDEEITGIMVTSQNTEPPKIMGDKEIGEKIAKITQEIEQTFIQKASPGKEKAGTSPKAAISPRPVPPPKSPRRARFSPTVARPVAPERLQRSKSAISERAAIDQHDRDMRRFRTMVHISLNANETDV